MCVMPCVLIRGLVNTATIDFGNKSSSGKMCTTLVQERCAGVGKLIERDA